MASRPVFKKLQPTYTSEVAQFFFLLAETDCPPTKVSHFLYWHLDSWTAVDAKLSFTDLTNEPLPAPSNMLQSIINDPDLALDRYDHGIFVITMKKKPENRISVSYAQKLIAVYGQIRSLLGEDSAGAVITKGQDEKFWCTGLDLDELDRNPYANTQGFFPLLATIMDFPFPTIALITGHTFGGAVPYSLAHDYRVMNSQRGFISMPPVDLGLHFPGIGKLPALKLRPQVARKMLLEAHKWTGKQALEDGIVDATAEPAEMFDVTMELAKKVAPKAKMGVYSLLRNELYGEAGAAFRDISYVHGRRTGTAAKAKI